MPRVLSRAQPKSSSRTTPCSSIRLSGEMSRWIKPCSCIRAKSPKSGSSRGNSSPGGMRPLCLTRSQKVVPSMYSMTM